MKKLIVFFSVIAVIIGFTGCTAVQVNERMFVHLMGIEESGGLCRLTVQVYSTEGAEPGKTSAPEFEVKTGIGRSFYEAVDVIMRESGKKLFFGHCMAIFADESLLRSPQKLITLAGERISVSCPVVYSETPSESVNVKDENDKLIGADEIYARLEHFSDEGLIMTQTLKSVTAAAAGGEIIALPFSKQEPSGTAVVDMNSGKTVFLDLSQTAAYNMMKEKENIHLAVMDGSAEVNKTDISVYFKNEENGGKYYISIVSECTLREVGDDHTLEEYRNELERIICASAEEICQYAYSEKFLGTIFPEVHSGDSDDISFKVTAEIILG